MITYLTGYVVYYIMISYLTAYIGYYDIILYLTGYVGYYNMITYLTGYVGCYDMITYSTGYVGCYNYTSNMDQYQVYTKVTLSADITIHLCIQSCLHLQQGMQYAGFMVSNKCVTTF